MRARFVGDVKRNGEGPEVIQAFGLAFLKGAWVGVDDLDPVSLKKLQGNSHFEVGEGKAGKGQPAAAAAPAAEPVKRGRKSAKPAIVDEPSQVAKSEDDDWGDLDPEA
jgi:hypothetical protein